MNAQSPCSFDWTDGLEKYPVYCRKEDGIEGKDSMVNSFVLNTVSGSEALTIFLPLGCTVHLQSCGKIECIKTLKYIKYISSTY